MDVQTFNGSESVLQAAANTTDTGSSAAEAGGSGKCLAFEIENTGASGMLNAAYINCRYKKSGRRRCGVD